MADRYWVGGSASWDGTAGTKWATTSGGTGGASAPTSADDVYFDAASGAVTVTVAAAVNCRSLIFTGFTGTFTGTSTISMYGTAVILSSGMTWTHSNTFGLRGNCTFTSNGKSITSPIQILDGVTVQLADALTTTGAITVSQGTFTTNNFNVTASQLSSSNSNTRTINLGSSTVTLSINGQALLFTTSTNLTFNAGTSNIILNGTGSDIDGGGLTFYDVSFTNTTATTGTTNLRYIDGNNTFNNLTVTGPASEGVVELEFRNNQTINGTWSVTGTAGNRRILFRSNTFGLRRTLRVNSVASFADVDFRDIIITGSATPLSGTRLGNLGSCTGITFDAPKTVYWNNTSGGNWTSNSWAASSGGSTSTDNFPLAQDTAVIENTGLNTFATITFNPAITYIGTINMSGRTNTMTISFSSASITCYGSWINGTGTGFTGSGGNGPTFSGPGVNYITSAGKSFPGGVYINTFGGSVILNDAISATGSSSFGQLIVTSGTFDTNGYSVTSSNISSSGSRVRAIYLRNSTVTLNWSQNNISMSNGTGLTFDAGTSTIISTNSSGSGTHFETSGQTFYNITCNNINQSSSVPTTFSGNIIISNNLTFSVQSNTGTARIQLNGNIVVGGTLTLTGTNYGSRVFLFSNTIGTQRTITANSWSASPADIDFKDIAITGNVGTLTGTRLGDCGNNSGISFSTPKTVYRVGSSTANFAGSNSWATSSNGTGDNANFPLAQDTAVFDDNTAATALSHNIAFNIGSLDFSNRTVSFSFTTGTAPRGLYGSLTLSSAVTLSGAVTIPFSGTSTQTVTTAGVTVPWVLNVNSPSTNVVLGSAYTSTNEIQLNFGTFDASTYNVTILKWNSINSNRRTLRMGTGLWTITGTDAWEMSTSTNATLDKGTANILLSNNTTTTRTFRGGGLSYNKLTIGGDTSTSTTSIEQSNTFEELASTKTVAHTIALGSTIQTFGKWTVTGTAGNIVTLTGTGTGHIIAGPAVTGIDYLAMGSIGFNGTGAASSPGEFYAGANSTGTAGAPVFRTAAPTPRTLYWVGGTGNWSDTSKWSLSSGGSGGQAIPTSLDDVIFDSLSSATGYTTTVNQLFRVRSATFSPPASGNLTWAGSSRFVVHESLTLPATNFINSLTGNITLSGSGTGKLLTTNGISLTNNALFVVGIDCEWLLGSNVTTGSQTLTVTIGTFDTNGYTFTCGNISSSNFNRRSIKFKNSTVTASGFNPITFTNSAGLTFDAGTSSLICTSFNVDLNPGAGQTFYNVTIGDSQNNAHIIRGNNTFNNLTVVNRNFNGTNKLSISGNQTVNGTFTVNGTQTQPQRRYWVRSSNPGVNFTITANALNCKYVDFRNITGAGTASWDDSSRTNYWGDTGGNSGITFSAGRNAYWNLSGSQEWAAVAWATTNNGTPALANYPLAQDTAIFTEAGACGTVRLDTQGYMIGNLTMADGVSNRTSAMTLNFGGFDLDNFFGNITLFSNLTTSGGGKEMRLSGYNVTQDVNTAGVNLPVTFSTVDGYNNTVRLQSSLLLTGRNFNLSTQSSFNANDYNITAATVSFADNISFGLTYLTNFKTLTLGTGTWTVTGTGTVWNAVPNMTVIRASGNVGNILLTDTSTSARTFAGGGYSYNKLTIGGTTGISTLTITGDNKFTEIASTKTVAHTIALGSSTLETGAFNVTGTAGNVVTITGDTSNLIYTGAGTISSDYLNVQGRVYGPVGETTGIWSAGENSINNGSLGWDFIAAPPPEASNANFFLLFA